MKWVMVVLLVACGSGKQTASSGSGSGSSTMLTPGDAAVAKDNATPIRFPACKQRATLTPIPLPAFRPRGAHLIAGQLVVGKDAGSAGKRDVWGYATFDLEKREWADLPDARLDGIKDGLPLYVTSSTHLMLTYEKRDGWGAVVLDVPKRTWTTMRVFDSPWSTVSGERFGDMLVAVPYRPCGFMHFELAHVVNGARFAPIPATLAPRARSFVESVTGKGILWGGDVYPDPPATGDIGCKDDDAKYKPIADGAIFDPTTRKWRAMASGAPPGARPFGVSDPYVFVIVETALWRYDAAADAWKRIGDLAVLGKDFILSARAVVGDHFAILQTKSPPRREVLVDNKTGSPRELPAPPQEIANAIAVDDRHLLALPRGEWKQLKNPGSTDPFAYLQDVTTGSWCELAWSIPHPYSYAVAERYRDRLVLWEFDGSGVEVTIR